MAIPRLSPQVTGTGRLLAPDRPSSWTVCGQTSSVSCTSSIASLLTLSNGTSLMCCDGSPARNKGAYHAFVERAAGDHREHMRLVDLLDAGDWHASPIPSAKLAVDTMPLLQRSNHPVLKWIFTRLDALQEASDEQDLDELKTTARFYFANIVLNEGDVNRANQLFTAALTGADPNWPVYANILNNRGITYLHLDRSDAANADFSSVIDAIAATDEARACALNNRADMHYEDGDLASAVADRTAVLALAETTYNRRFIALARRARALWALGDQIGAYQDIETVVATADIAQEQKMAARLQRARWLMASGAPADALPDLEAVIGSHRNFDEVERSARELVAGLQMSPDETES